MNELTAVERPKPLFLALAGIGLVVAVFASAPSLLVLLKMKSGTVDYAMFAMSGSLILFSLIGLGFKRVATLNKKNKTLSINHYFFIPLTSKKYDFEQLSSVYVRKELATNQSSDIADHANVSYRTIMYLVYADLKGFGKRKRRIRLKRFFDQKQADDLATQASRIIN